MPNGVEAQLQAYGDSRDSFSDIEPDIGTDYTVDKSVLVTFVDTDPLPQVVRALKRLRESIRKGKMTAA